MALLLFLVHYPTLYRGTFTNGVSNRVLLIYRRCTSYDDTATTMRVVFLVASHNPFHYRVSTNKVGVTNVILAIYGPTYYRVTLNAISVVGVSFTLKVLDPALRLRTYKFVGGVFLPIRYGPTFCLLSVLVVVKLSFFYFGTIFNHDLCVYYHYVCDYSNYGRRRGGGGSPRFPFSTWFSRACLPLVSESLVFAVSWIQLVMGIAVLLRFCIRVVWRSLQSIGSFLFFRGGRRPNVAGISFVRGGTPGRRGCSLVLQKCSLLYDFTPIYCESIASPCEGFLQDSTPSETLGCTNTASGAILRPFYPS